MVEKWFMQSIPKSSYFSGSIYYSKMAEWLIRFSKVSFLGGILVSPFRYRLKVYSISISPIYGDYTDGLVFLSDFFLIIAIALGGIGFAINRSKLSLGLKSISIPIMGLILVAFVGVPFSVHPLVSIYHSIRLVLLFGFYLYLVNIKPERRLILWGVAGMIAIQSVVGIAQVMEQSSIGLQALGEYELNPDWSGVSIVWAEGVRSLRAYGLSDHPNILGGIFSFGLILLTESLFDSRFRKMPLIIGVYISGIMGLFFTFSRAAWLSFIVGLGFVFLLLLLMREHSKVYTLLGILGSTALIMFPIVLSNLPLLGVRLNAQRALTENAAENRSIEERVALNQAANQMFTENALLGVGIGTFPIALKETFPQFRYNFQPVHLTILNAAVETGIFGALLYLLILIMPWSLMFFHRRRIKFSKSLIASSALLLAISLVGMFDYYTWLLTPGRFWQFMAWGLWSNAFTASKRKTI